MKVANIAAAQNLQSQEMGGEAQKTVKSNTSNIGFTTEKRNSEMQSTYQVQSDQRKSNASPAMSRKSSVNIEEQSISKPKDVIEVQKSLLARGKTVAMNPIALNNAFDTVGSNGIFQASPAVVKFCGFEANKTHTLKVRMINISPAPQRLHILPPQTQQFKIRYAKKGMIPTGVSEDIYILFTPTAANAHDSMSAYKYYYDTIRIHCEGDKILIPIHAFPVINSNYPDQIPKLVDMGQMCRLGNTYQKSISIKSICPVTFEYEITVLKAHPEIQIESPLSGDIMGMQVTEIHFTYQPVSFSTAEIEIQIKTTEFDSQPKIVRIVGNSAPYSGPPIDISMKNEEGQSKTLLQSTKQFNAQTRLKKLKVSMLPGDFQEEQDTKGTLTSLKSVKLSQDEQNFIIEYRKLEDLEREKGIKFFQCVGDVPHTQEFVDNLIHVRDALLEGNQNKMRNQDVHRFVTEVNSDKVVVDTTASQEILAKPKWDSFENNHFAMRRRLVAIFLRVANQLICRLRAGKRLSKLKAWIQSHNIKTRLDMTAKVNEDFKKAIKAGVVDVDDGSSHIRNMRFKFGFNADVLKSAIMKLPLQYEANMSSFLEKIEANPPNNFDDLVPFDPLEMLEFETEAYKEFTINPISFYDPPFRDQRVRPGCEYESIIRMRSGEPDLEKAQFQAHEQAEMLKQDKKDIVSGAIVKMPNGFLKPLDYGVELLVRSDQHPTIRAYVSQKGIASTEVDPHFSLYPYERQRNEIHDEITLKKQSVAKDMKEKGYAPLVSQTFTLGLTKTMGGNYVNSLDVPSNLLPGNFGCRVVDQMMPVDLSVVHKDRKNMATSSFACDTEKWIVPEPLRQPEQTDYLTDEESDDGAGFELRIPALKDLIQEFEIGDEAIIARESDMKIYFTDLKARGFEKELRDEITLTKMTKSTLLNSNISQQREFYSAKMPSIIQELNTAIKAPQNKIYLR